MINLLLVGIVLILLCLLVLSILTTRRPISSKEQIPNKKRRGPTQALHDVIFVREDEEK